MDSFLLLPEAPPRPRPPLGGRPSPLPLELMVVCSSSNCVLILDGDGWIRMRGWIWIFVANIIKSEREVWYVPYDIYAYGCHYFEELHCLSVTIFFRRGHKNLVVQSSLLLCMYIPSCIAGCNNHDDHSDFGWRIGVMIVMK